MARILITGFETGFGANTASFVGQGPEGRGGVGQTLASSVVRSGTTSLTITNSINSDQIYLKNPLSLVYGSVWIRKTANPAAETPILSFSAGPASIYMDTDGSLIIKDSSTITVASNLGKIENDSWTCIEFLYNGTVVNTYLSLKIDGVLYANAVAVAGVPNQLSYIFLIGVTTTSTTYYDDLILDDATWVGSSSRVALLRPISDNQRGSWTGGAGGTTNLWEAINNTPSIGTATETDSTQIESADSSGDNATDEYRINLTTYFDAGIRRASWIKNAMLFVISGEDVATGTKNITAGMQANPAGSLPTGWDVSQGTSGALGTYPAGWWWNGIVQTADFSGVTVTSSPVVNLRKTDTGTRVASVSFVGLYVEYTPTSDLAQRAFPRPALNF